jgi:hypothetical protein
VLASDSPAAGKASLACSQFSLARGGKRVALTGARIEVKPGAGDVIEGKPLKFELRLTLPKNYRLVPEGDPVYDVVTEGRYEGEATVKVGDRVVARVPLQVAVKRRPRQ